MKKITKIKCKANWVEEIPKYPWLLKNKINRML